jgi:hypothetical protein
MRKPLELHVYEKHAEADAYRVGGFYSPYALVGADKRFADAELAAEAYRQMTRSMAESGVVSEVKGNDLIVASGDAAVFGPVRVETSRLGDMRRFATLPHYDEVAA